MTARPHCRQPDACTAAKPTTHCRRCCAASLRAIPEIEAKRVAAQNAYYARPEVKAALTVRIKAAQAKSLEDPAARERLRERGRWLQREHASRPEVKALTHSPEARAKRGAAITAMRLAHIPEHLRDTYRDLVRRKGLTAADAEACIRDILETPQRDARRAIADFDHRQRQRAERDRAQSY